MSAHQEKLSARKREAIGALLEQMDVAAAASAVDVSPQKLARWMKEAAFDAEYRAAKRADFRRHKARLRQGARGAAASALDLMGRAKNPATRLDAALLVIGIVEDADEIEEFAAGVAEVARLSYASDTGEGGTVGMRGHGAKFPRRKEKAITALLQNASVARAALAVGTSTPTLYRWMQVPAFDAELMATAREVYEPAMMLLRNRVGAAMTIVRSYSGDRTIPEKTRLKADRYLLHEMKADQKEQLEAKLAELESAPQSGEPQAASKQEPSKALGKSLHQRLQRLRAGLLQAGGQRGPGMTFVHAVDGKPAGCSVAGHDGRHVWQDPPEGRKKGEPVEEQTGPVPDLAA